LLSFLSSPGVLLPTGPLLIEYGDTGCTDAHQAAVADDISRENRG
jgi:hypothetical protein